MSVSAEGKAGSGVLNVPNQLTAARLVLSIAVFVLLPLQMYLPALIVFVVAASTDWMDGWYARRYGQVTKLGRVFDPFVDKIIICGTFVFLAVETREFPWYGRIAAWMAVLVIARELLVTVLRSAIEQGGGDFSARWSGKLKMLFQCLAAGAAMAALMYARPSPAAVPAWIMWSLIGSVWLAVALTVYSGAVYVVAAAKYFR